MNRNAMIRSGRWAGVLLSSMLVLLLALFLSPSSRAARAALVNVKLSGEMQPEGDVSVRLIVRRM